MFCRTSSRYLSSLPRQLQPQQIGWRSIAAIGSYRAVSTLPPLPIFKAISQHDPQSTVVVHSKSGRRFTYGELLKDVAERRARLVEEGKGIEGERVAFLVENGYDYVGALFMGSFLWLFRSWREDWLRKEYLLI